ncbi:acyl-CoA thioesterase [Micromonospora sp. FIMYZ51]|uniref:acyl-CoA thioesterase n=1 Tax=Micromonospora sp. FIMYZ51 TaxID=3051832 RepID=UPI00311F055E
MSSRVYRYRHRVTFDETNLVGNVYFAHYAHWQGHCREHFLADHAPGVLTGLSTGLALVTVSLSMEFYAECHALDLVDVEMSLVELSGNRITMAFDYRRTGQGATTSELVASGRQTVAVMSRADGHLRPEPVPADLAAALAPYASPTTHRPAAARPARAVR